MTKDNKRDDDIYNRYQQLLSENIRLREQNTRLRDENGLLREENARLRGTAKSGGDGPTFLRSSQVCPVSARAAGLSQQAKINLFRNLFRGRDDVYPVRWENRQGASGYSPRCANEWKRSVCDKTRVKCGTCQNRELLPLTDDVVRDHLTGRYNTTIGVYPLLPDETCWFLAADFDKATWQDDCKAFLATCREMSIPAALERSRSGNGGHIWIFFTQPIQASLARQLGSAVLTRTMQRGHQMGLDSYDRFFPSQDTMPKGGFGNLIALPLQHDPRQKGNSVFLDDKLEPYADQWSFLSNLPKMMPQQVDSVVREAARTGSIMGVKRAPTDEDEEQSPWSLPPSHRKMDVVPGPLPEEVRITLGNMVYVEKEGLPHALINRLLRLAAFQNPQFYKAQAMRLPVFRNKKIIPRIIACAEDFPGHIGLPRGCLDEVLDLLSIHDIRVKVVDERFPGTPIGVTFKGVLDNFQAEAARALMSADNGILLAATAFGKTVVAAWIIAARKVNTLVIVDSTKLLEQWRQKLAAFLDLAPESVGQIGDSKMRPNGMIDVAMIQSLYHKGEKVVDDLVGEYGQVIFDECHHVSAFTFEQVLKQAKARYVVGLTATLTRKDGLHPIVVMQCGAVRFRFGAKKSTSMRPFEHVVMPRITTFTPPGNMVEPGIQEICSALVTDQRRNDLICDDVLQALTAKRSPLILTQRKEHVDHLAEKLQGLTRNVIVLKGGMGKKQRKAVAERLAAIADGEERVIVATGRYIGEGFDDARLDTLFLVGPISWRGTLQQYAGRLHRLHHDKKVVQIYDYVDTQVPMLYRMYQRRVEGYKGMGYRVEESQPI